LPPEGGTAAAFLPPVTAGDADLVTVALLGVVAVGGAAFPGFACDAAAAVFAPLPILAALPPPGAFFFRTLFLIATFLPREGDGDLLESELLEPLE